MKYTRETLWQDNEEFLQIVSRDNRVSLCRFSPGKLKVISLLLPDEAKKVAEFILEVLKDESE